MKHAMAALLLTLLAATPAYSDDFMVVLNDWVSAREKFIRDHGVPLSARQMDDARAAGVRHPERIRIMTVDEIPAPEAPMLAAMALKAGLVSPDNVGLTLGYGVMLRRDHAGERALAAHEFTHVAQHERLGGLAPFVAKYLEEVRSAGYTEAPLELEARAVEEKFNRLTP